VAEPLANQVIDLEGEDLVVVELGHSDTDDTTCLHAPSIGLVATGDAVYNDVHLYLSESGPEGRREWLSALDRIEALDPKTVVCGHKRVDRPDSPTTIEETRRYIRDFDAMMAITSTARELYDQMKGLYPNRINPGALWGSALALRPHAVTAPPPVG
jgi:glyoxylase-like metal-dependent hydrolase (beta-lactamase superfamily II)